MFTSKEITIIGFGNQAKAWSMNLRDSGWEVKIALRPNSDSFKKCELLNFKTQTINTQVDTTFCVVLTPDETHEQIVQEVSKNSPKTCFIYAHGFSLLYTDILNSTQNNHALLAPKAIASELRFEYESHGKSGAIWSDEFLKDKELASSIIQLATDLGITSLHKASIKEETIADLFSEQTLLCSTLPYSALLSFNKLCEKGISPEVAFFECWHEVKLIANTMVKLGPEKFFELISPNALIGSEVGRSLFFNDEYNKKLDDVFEHINNGNFNENLKSTDFEKVRKNITSFWKNQQLTDTHKKLQSELYS